MDWYLNTTQAGAVAEVKDEISAYLHRHATEPDGEPDADIVVAELLGNVVRHASGPTWVSLIWSGPQPLLTVYDLGPGFEFDPRLPDDALAEGGRGLFIVSHLAGHLTGVMRDSGGSKLTALLPVTRADVASHDPPRHLDNALPRLEEALPDGGFGRGRSSGPSSCSWPRRWSAPTGPARPRRPSPRWAPTSADRWRPSTGPPAPWSGA